MSSRADVRLFVAAALPDDVLDALAALGDPRGADLRWVDRSELHVTLRFLGEVPDADVPALVDALAEASLPAAEAAAGPTVTRLGRQVLCVPVAGVDALAAAVVAATAGFGVHDPRPYRGHVTLARARGRRGAVDRRWTGAPVAERWPVTEVRLVRSHLGTGRPGSRYEDIAAFPTA